MKLTSKTSLTSKHSRNTDSEGAARRTHGGRDSSRSYSSKHAAHNTRESTTKGSKLECDQLGIAKGGHDFNANTYIFKSTRRGNSSQRTNG